VLSYIVPAWKNWHLYRTLLLVVDARCQRCAAPRWWGDGRLRTSNPVPFLLPVDTRDDVADASGLAWGGASRVSAHRCKPITIWDIMRASWSDWGSGARNCLTSLNVLSEAELCRTRRCGAENGGPNA
jgi:hypothetical protein